MTCAGSRGRCEAGSGDRAGIEMMQSAPMPVRKANPLPALRPGRERRACSPVSTPSDAKSPIEYTPPHPLPDLSGLGAFAGLVPSHALQARDGCPLRVQLV